MLAAQALAASSHTSAPKSGGRCFALKLSFFQRFSPPEAAVTVNPTMAHRLQGCRPFRVSPPTPLSVQLMRSIGEMRSSVNKILSQKQREIGHLDKPTLRNKSILKMAFQDPTSLERRACPKPVELAPSPAKNLNTLLRLWWKNGPLSPCLRAWVSEANEMIGTVLTSPAS